MHTHLCKWAALGVHENADKSIQMKSREQRWWWWRRQWPFKIFMQVKREILFHSNKKSYSAHAPTSIVGSFNCLFASKILGNSLKTQASCSNF